MSITADDYWKGRDKKYPLEFTARVRANGELTRTIVNELLDMFEADTGVKLMGCSSGWRPLGINERTLNAAEHSRHISAEAEDVADTEHRDLARWIAANQDELVRLGLWCERFEWTPTWVHFQIVPPPSGRRFYRPSSADPMCKRLPEQDQFDC